MTLFSISMRFPLQKDVFSEIIATLDICKTLRKLLVHFENMSGYLENIYCTQTRVLLSLIDPYKVLSAAKITGHSLHVYGHFPVRNASEQQKTAVPFSWWHAGRFLLCAPNWRSFPGWLLKPALREEWRVPHLRLGFLPGSLGSHQEENAATSFAI